MAITEGCFADAPPIEDAGTSTADASTGSTPGTTMSASSGAEDVGDVTTVGMTTSVDVTGVPTTTDDTGVGETNDPETSGTTGVPSSCGDDMLDVGEDCDDGNNTPGDGCHSDCTRYKLVFVTSEPLTGAMGGLGGADEFCRSAAEAAGVEGSFAAWLSDDTTAAAFRLAGATIAYRLHDGTRIAADWADMIDGAIENPIWIDEHGNGLDSGAFAWTGTSEFGAILGSNCGNWSPSAATGQVGAVDWAEPAHWTAQDEHGCGQLNRLYCFEQ